MSTNEPVVTVTPTLADGTVVRWHLSVRAATNMSAVVSASRRGVAVHTTYLQEVPADWLAAATAAYEQLVRDPGAGLGHLATHRNSVVSNGPLVPVEREADRGEK